MWLSMFLQCFTKRSVVLIEMWDGFLFYDLQDFAVREKYSTVYESKEGWFTVKKRTNVSFFNVVSNHITWRASKHAPLPRGVPDVCKTENPALYEFGNDSGNSIHISPIRSSSMVLN